jgi:hypothetical protein
MTDMDQPPQYQKPKTVQQAPKKKIINHLFDKEKEITNEDLREVRKDPFIRNVLDENERGVQEAIKRSKNPSAYPAQKEDPNFLHISSGQVKMTVPKSWKEGETNQNQVVGDSYRDFCINGDRDARLSFFYRGRRCSEAMGKLFLKALKAPPQELSDSDFIVLQPVTRMPKDFVKKSARTEDLNGRHVLVVEGSQSFGKSDQEDVKAIYIDSDGTGTAVQEIYFLAKPNKFKEHLAEVNKALKAIVWI